METAELNWIEIYHFEWLSDMGLTMNETRVYDPRQSLGGSMNRIENLYPAAQRPTSFSNHLRSSYPRIVAENPQQGLPLFPPMPSIVLIPSDRPHSSGSLSSSSTVSSGSIGSSDYYTRIELAEESSAVADEHYSQLAQFEHIPFDQLKVVNRLAEGCFGEVKYCVFLRYKIFCLPTISLSMGENYCYPIYILILNFFIRLKHGIWSMYLFIGGNRKFKIEWWN